MGLIVKVHKRNEQSIVAVCDSSLLGQVFEEGDKFLDLRSDFYKGELRDVVEVGDLLRNADVVNVVGSESIKLALEEDVIDESIILYVSGVPHAQSVLVGK